MHVPNYYESTNSRVASIVYKLLPYLINENIVDDKKIYCPKILFLEIYLQYKNFAIFSQSSFCSEAAKRSLGISKQGLKSSFE